MKQKKRRIRVLPDRTFSILWTYANKQKQLSKDEYVKVFLSHESSHYIPFYRLYEIDELSARDMLCAVYDAAKKTFRELLEEANIKKADCSYIFCIPIRTVEDWYSNKSSCNAYIRLMLIRHFYLLNLGNYIYLQSEMDRQACRPRIYQKHTPQGKTRDEKLLEDIDNRLKAFDEEPFLMDYDEYEDMHNTFERRSYASPAQEILARTNYLQSRIQGQKKDRDT